MRKFLIPLVLALLAVTAWAQYGVVVWDPVEGADGYVVYKWDGAAITPLAVVAGDTFFSDMTVAEDDSTWYRVAAYAGVDTAGNIGNLTSQFWAYADLAPNINDLAFSDGGTDPDTVRVDWTPIWMSLDFTATSLNVAGADSFKVYRGKYTNEVLGGWQSLGLHSSGFGDLSTAGSPTWAEGDTLAYYAESFYSWGVDGYGSAVGDTVEVVAAAPAAGADVAHSASIIIESTSTTRQMRFALYEWDGEGTPGAPDYPTPSWAVRDSTALMTTTEGAATYNVEFENQNIDVGTGYWVLALICPVSNYVDVAAVSGGIGSVQASGDGSGVPETWDGSISSSQNTLACWVENSSGSLILGHSDDPVDYTTSYNIGSGSNSVIMFMPRHGQQIVGSE